MSPMRQAGRLSRSLVDGGNPDAPTTGDSGAGDIVQRAKAAAAAALAKSQENPPPPPAATEQPSVTTDIPYRHAMDYNDPSLVGTRSDGFLEQIIDRPAPIVVPNGPDRILVGEPPAPLIPPSPVRHEVPDPRLKRKLFHETVHPAPAPEHPAQSTPIDTNKPAKIQAPAHTDAELANQGERRAVIPATARAHDTKPAHELTLAHVAVVVLAIAAAVGAVWMLVRRRGST